MEDSKKITIVTFFIMLTFLSICAAFYFKKMTTDYKIGDSVILKDGSRWHVIVDSVKSEKYVTLLSDTSIDLNGDGISNDTIEYNTNNYNKNFSTSTINNYLINTYMKTLIENEIEFGSDGEVRLITLEELLKIGSYTKVNDTSHFPIYNAKKVPEWLQGSNFGTYGYWWTMSPNVANDNELFVVKNDGSIVRDTASNKYTNSIRPVIKILKSNL